MKGRKNNKKKAKKHTKKPAKKIENSATVDNRTGIQPLQDRVLIIEDTESQGQDRKTSSGIIIPMSAEEDKGGKRGTVAAIGKGRTEDGRVIAVSVKVGDKVLFQWGDKIKLGEQEYYVVKESEILAVIK